MKLYSEKGFHKIKIEFDDLAHQIYCVHMFRLNGIAIHSLCESKSSGDFYIEGFVKEQSLAKIEEYLIKGREYFKQKSSCNSLEG